VAGNKLDYRRYGEALLEILIAGGLLAPGGSIQQDGEGKTVSTRACIFMDAPNLDRIKQWDNVVIKLMRRYKYLEKMLSEEMKKILVYLR
jgi:agmatine/peptidylarginine deiminase